MKRDDDPCSFTAVTRLSKAAPRRIADSRAGQEHDPHVDTAGLVLIQWASLACRRGGAASPTDGAYERDVQIARNLTEQSRQATVAANRR
jgi:hypothetical protein